MSETNYGNVLNVKGLARGQNRKFISFSGRNTILPISSGYEYFTGIVIDVISDPKLFFNTQGKINNFYSDLGSNLNFVGEDKLEENLTAKIPKNSIICKIIDDGQSLFSKEKILCYPFFSPHFSVPIKPGEHVWLLEEKFRDISRFYWMNRKHGSYYNDDINLTSHEREVSIYVESPLKEGDKSLTDEELLSIHNFPNVSNKPTDGNLNLDNFYKTSTAYQKEFTNEPVPDIVKKCGDLVLQGSNNTLIQMTTEKFTISEELNKRYSKNLFLPKDQNLPDDIYRVPQSPAIDICVARKKKHFSELIKKVSAGEKIIEHSITEKDKLSLIQNNRNGIPGLENYEINKFNENFYSNKDTDPSNCGARLYLSNNCNIDEIFNLADTEKSKETFQQFSGATLIGYSEHIRFIAEGDSSSFRIVKKHNDGETFFEINNEGIVRIGSKESNKSPEKTIQEGIQSFVRGEDLEKILKDLVSAINDNFSAIKTGMETNIAPIMGPNVPLQTAATSINDLTINCEPFKSKLIKGE